MTGVHGVLDGGCRAEQTEPADKCHHREECDAASAQAFRAPVHHSSEVSEDNGEMDVELRAFLRDAGAPDEDIARAESEGWLPLLALDRILTPGRPQYDLEEFARASGFDEPLLQRLWRALGFPDVPPDARVFTDRDLEAARRLA